MQMFDIMIDFIQAGIYVFFICRYFSINCSFFRKFICICSIAGLAIMINAFTFSEGFLNIAAVITLTVFARMNSDRNLISCLTAAVMPLIMTCCTSGLAYLTTAVILHFQGTFQEFYQQNIQVPIVIVANVLLLLFSFVIAGIRRRFDVEITRKDAFFLFLTTIAVYALATYTLMQWPYAGTRFKSYLPFTVLEIVIFTLMMIQYFFSLQRQKELSEEKLEHKLTEFSRLHTREIVEMNQETHRLHHEINHILQAVDVQLRDGKIDYAEEIIQRYFNQLDQMRKLTSSPSSIIDYEVDLLSRKAEKKLIDFHFDINFYSCSAVSDYDLAVILGNVFDNAVENCSGDPLFISVEIHQIDNTLKFTVVNSTAQETKKDTKKERFKSNKGKNHGYGLSIVKDTVKENNGYFEIMDNGNTVSVVIVLPARKE